MSVRFAPSPTGRFHLGNLRTAWISYEFARSLSVPWVVRFEDIDEPRVVPGAQDQQLADLRELGLHPDRILVQSHRKPRHEELFRRAIESGKVYPCSCSRKEVLENLQGLASAPHSGEAPIYSGKCRDPRNRSETQHPGLAWRVRNPEDPSGAQDFIVARTLRDGSAFTSSYHWACAIDDYDGEHSLLVRASDLAHVIPQQRLIYRWVGEIESQPRKYPAVFHTALVVANDGHRLEKRTRGVTLPEMIAAGISVEELRKRFQASFEPAHLSKFSPGRTWGETPERIQLDQLGF